MKVIKHLFVVFLIAFVLGSVVLPVSAREKNQEMSEEQKKMVKLWEKYTTPGENHKILQYFVGEWESTIKSWRGPGRELVTRTQEIKVESFFEGRFTKAHIKTDAGDIGMVFETIVINGYDNFKQECFSITLGKLRTDYYLTAGKWDKAGKIGPTPRFGQISLQENNTG